MVDRDLILAKAGSVKRHLNRVEEKSNADIETFLNDIDRQEIILFNLQMAIQNCIDIAAHIISDEGLGFRAALARCSTFWRKINIWIT